MSMQVLSVLGQKEIILICAIQKKFMAGKA